MRSFVFAVAVVSCLAPALASGQQASSAETRAVAAIGQCLLEGLPAGWRQAHVILELPSAGAETADVQYLVARADAAEDVLEPFTPCNPNEPARALLIARDSVPQKRRDWTVMRLVLNNDGQFWLSYVYAK